MDKRAILSHNRAIFYGKRVDIFDYQIPFFWNVAPAKKSVGVWGKSGEKRKDNRVAVRDYFIRLVLGNISVSKERPKFITYTFGSDIKDVDTANKLWSAHVKKLTRYFGFKLRYVVTIEFQPVSGRVHYHALIFDMPYTPGLKNIMRYCLIKHTNLKAKILVLHGGGMVLSR